MKAIKNIKIDQIRFTIPINESFLKDTDEPNVIKAINRYFKFKLLFDEPVIKPTGKNGYTNSILWGASEQGGLMSVMYKPPPVDMQVLIDFTATAKYLYR